MNAIKCSAIAASVALLAATLNVGSVSAGSYHSLPDGMADMHHHMLAVPGRAVVGMPAPLFSLEAVSGKEFKQVKLADFRGKWVVLFFYPYDFSMVCPTEIRGFNDALALFGKLNAVVLGASTDSRYSHLAWIKRGDLGDLGYPLLADFRKETTKSYGVLDETTGAAQRGLFIIDPQGILQYQVVHNASVGRSVDEILRVLEALQTGELCPVNWKKGEKTLGK